MGCSGHLQREKQVMSLTEKIKQIFADFSDVMASCRNDEFLEDFYQKTLEWQTKAAKDVLAELTNYEEKWQEIVDLIQNRPPTWFTPDKGWVDPKKTAEWLEVLEAKVAELSEAMQ